MTVMECSHGWHQRDSGLFCTKAVDGATQCRNRADDHGASRHLDSTLVGKEAMSPDLAADGPTLSRSMLGGQARNTRIRRVGFDQRPPKCVANHRHAAAARAIH